MYAGEDGIFTCLTVQQWDFTSKTLGPFEINNVKASVSIVSRNTVVKKMLHQAWHPTIRGTRTLQETIMQSLEKSFSKIMETKCFVWAALLNP